MSISDFRELGESPDRPFASPNGNILQVFPPTTLDFHFRNGYHFRLDPCGVVTGYDPDYCGEHAPKMYPNFYGPEVNVPVRMIQSAFACSTIGATDDELRFWARTPIELKLWTQVDTILTTLLQAQAINQTPFPIPGALVLAKAAQYLATNSRSGTGIIYGPMSWISELGMDYLIKWESSTNSYHDTAGNIIIPSSVDGTRVYAFDSFVDIKASTIQILDEFAPELTKLNERTVRAEQLYTVAIGPCVVGSFDIGITAIGTSVVVEPGTFPLNVNIVAPSSLPVTFTRLNCATDSVTICPGASPIPVTLAGAASGVFKYIAGAATTVVKASTGNLHRISILEGSGGNTATIYDNAVGPGIIIAVLNVSSLLGTLEFGGIFNNGLTIVTTGADTKLSVVFD